ncbi:MAG: serine/threonine protein kinase [Alphaproteobacteria bacterium]|nr:serine/threonine protein kinase [Alphaproteobacteria bacterium]
MEPRRRFRFLKELSEGNFGKVYMAEMITGDSFRSIVAIKLLHGKWLGHEEIVQRSRDEARVLGLLHHRNIIRVEDLTSINGQCAVVMEYLDGVDLKTLINWCRERDGRIPRKVAFEVIAAAASALEAAYNQPPLAGGSPLHLIHRDIKPSNVMVTRAGDVKVLDFGTAQAKFDEREAHTQALAFGSAAYMAPERLLGDPDAPSGDVFSLGVTLYEMLTAEGFGKIHIRPEKFDAALEDRVDDIDLSDLGPERTTQVKQVLRLILAYEPEDRPTARQVVDLMEALADEVHDGTMRRFARNVVGPCRDELEPEPDPHDPLTGSTLFEDRTASMDDNVTMPPDGELAQGGGTDNTWAGLATPPEPSVDQGHQLADPGEADGGYDDGYDDGGLDAANPFQVPPELATPDTPQDQISQAHSVPAHDDWDEEQPTVLASADDLDGLDIEGPQRPDFGAPDLGPPEPTPPPMPVAMANEPALDSAPPPPVARSAVPRSITPAVAPPPEPRPPTGAGGALGPGSKPQTVSARPQKSGGGKGIILGVAAIVFLGVVGVGGLVGARAMGIIGGDGGSTPATDGGGDDGVVDAGGDRGVPGGRIEVGPMGGENGALTLVVAPAGQATVSISSMTGFKQDWDGSGTLELVGLPSGTYKTKVSPTSGSTVRGTVEVQAGRVCSYELRLDQDSDEWQAAGCE